MIRCKLALILVSAILLRLATAIETITVEGKYFFFSNGTRFYIKGIAYQRDAIEMGLGKGQLYDPLADKKACDRDVPEFKKLGMNTIRVYAIDDTKNHDYCMSLLAQNDIYVIADLSSPLISIESHDPKWNIEIMDRYCKVIDVLAKYDNILGFFGGNEVVNETKVSGAAPFAKASIRDIKRYIKQSNYRKIPIGYSTDDHKDTRNQISKFFVCGDDEDAQVDFLGVNMYEWCGDSTIEKSGYGDRTRFFKTYPIPVFFSEYGCNKVEPRKFTEIAALYSKEMTDVWSGGLVFMYVNQKNNFGIVDIKNDETLRELDDFKYLSSELNAVKPAKLELSEYKKTITKVDCPTQDSDWLASNLLPGVASDFLCECMYSTLECTIKDNVNKADYEDIFNYVCGEIDCSAIRKDGTKGRYGAYSVCTAKQQLGFVMNSFYKQKGFAASCNFDNRAQLRNAPSRVTDCESLLDSAGTDGATPIYDAPIGTISTTGKTSSNKKSQASLSTSQYCTGNTGTYGLIATILAAVMAL